MASLQKIQTRLKSVNNINKITKAMEVVAATKMRRSQEIALASRPYTYAALDVLGVLSRIEDVPLPPLLTRREVVKRAFVVVTSDKGLAGSFNSAVLKRFSSFARDEHIDLHDRHNTFIAVGQKAANFLERETHGVQESFVRFGDYTTTEEVAPLSRLLIDGYLDGMWDEVRIFSTHFKSALQQNVLVDTVLPVSVEHVRTLAREIVPERGAFADFVEAGDLLKEETGPQREYIIEPSAVLILDRLSRHLVDMELYHIVLEANASEHAARRVAMKNASDNAENLGDELTVLYNKSRQALVTGQIIEIAAGAESLQQ